MRLAILLYALGLLLKRAPKKYHVIKERISARNATLLVRTRNGRTARSFSFRNGTIDSRRGAFADADAALVWVDAKRAFKTLTSGYDGDFLKDLNRGDLAIKGDPGLVFWFSSTLREIKDLCSK